MAKEDIKDLKSLHQEKNAELCNLTRARDKVTEDKKFENLEAEEKKKKPRPGQAGSCFFSSDHQTL